MTGFAAGDEVCAQGWQDTVFTVVHGPVANRAVPGGVTCWYLIAAADGGHLLAAVGDLWPAASHAPAVGHGTSTIRDGMLYVKLDKTWWFAHTWLKAPVQDDGHYR